MHAAAENEKHTFDPSAGAFAADAGGFTEDVSQRFQDAAARRVDAAAVDGLVPVLFLLLYVSRCLPPSSRGTYIFIVDNNPRAIGVDINTVHGSNPTFPEHTIDPRKADFLFRG
jgi:hypothetical protein